MCHQVKPAQLSVSKVTVYLLIIIVIIIITIIIIIIIIITRLDMTFL